MYIYESHLGGLFASEENIDIKYRYCDSCGDYDYQLGEVFNREELRELIKEDYFVDEYIEEFINKTFPE